MQAHNGLHLVDLVFVGSLITITLITFWIRYGLAKLPISSIFEVYSLLAISSSMTMGILAIWAAFSDSVANHLPIPWMIAGAGLVAIFWGAAKILNPLLPKTPATATDDKLETIEHDDNVSEFTRRAA